MPITIGMICLGIPVFLLIVGFIVIIVLVAIGNIGKSASATFQSVANSMIAEQPRVSQQAPQRDPDEARPQKPKRQLPPRDEDEPKQDQPAKRPPPMSSDLPEVKPVDPKAETKPKEGAKPDADTSEKSKPAVPTKESQDEQKAASKLKIAKRLWEEGGKEKAKDVRDLLEELIYLFPKTEAAKEAKALLDKIPKK